MNVYRYGRGVHREVARRKKVAERDNKLAPVHVTGGYSFRPFESLPEEVREAQRRARAAAGDHDD